MVNRLPCLVPGCRRTTGEPCGEWICPKHWRVIPLKRRKAYKRARDQDRPYEVRRRLWDRLRQMAININFTEGF